MENFKRTEPKALNPKKKSRISWKIKGYIILIMVTIMFFTLFGLLVKEYIETHTFEPQSPVILRTPVIIKRVEIISPLSSPSATVGVAYAQEIDNPYDPKSPKGITWELNKDKFGMKYWGSLEELVRRESNFNPYAINSSSGACGMFQSYPCSKMGVELWDYEGQIKWGLDYIEDRYENPAKALKFHDENGWY